MMTFSIVNKKKNPPHNRRRTLTKPPITKKKSNGGFAVFALLYGVERCQAASQ